jgi:hypothetical protein
MLDGLCIANIQLILCSKPSQFWTAILHNPIRSSWISYCNASPPPSCTLSHTNENSCCHWCPTAPLCNCASAPSRPPYAMPAPLPATAYFLPFPSTSLAQPWYHLGWATSINGCLALHQQLSMSLTCPCCCPLTCCIHGLHMFITFSFDFRFYNSCIHFS